MTSPNPSSGSPAPASPNKNKKWLKRSLIAGGGAVGVLALAVLLTPTLLSTGAGKSFVLGQVNASLKGRIEIDSWSLGWFSPITVTGVKVFDDQNRLAVTVPSVKTGLTVLSAARGNLDLGETLIDSPNLVLFELRKDGTDNLSAVAGPSDPNAKVVIPELKGNVTIKNLTATIQGDTIGTPIRIDSSDLVVKIPSLANAPVSADIKLVVRRDNTAPGTLTVKGETQAIFAGEIDPNRLTTNQTITLTSLDLGIVAPFLAASGVNLSGIADGNLTASAKGLDAASVSGELRVKDLAASGDALKGDTFKTALLSVPLNISTTKGPDGTPLVKIDKFGVDSAELKVSASGELTQGALNRLKELKSPNAAGSLEVAVVVPDLGVVAGQLRNTLSLASDVQVSGGALNVAAKVQIAPTSVSLVSTTSLDNVRGTSAGRAISLEPVLASANLKADFSDTGLTALDIAAADLTSAFAKASAKGNLTDLNYTADIDLGKLRQQLGQFVDFGAAEFTGRLVSSGSAKGDLLSKTAEVAVEARTELTAVRVSLPGEREAPGISLDVDRLLVDSDALLKPGADTRVGTAEVRKLIVEAGRAGSPLVAVNATATADLTTSDVPSFDISKLDINSLPDAQRRYGALVPALKELALEFPTGVVRASLAGSYVGGTLTTARPVRVTLGDVSVLREGRRVLWRDNINLALAGTVATLPSLRAELTQLDLTSASNLVSAKQVGDKLLVELRPDGSATGSGTLTFAADLAAASRSASAWTGTPPAQEVRSGRVAGQLALTEAPNTPSSVNASLDVTDLTVGNTLVSESLKLAATATSADRFKTLTASADVGSRFASIALRDAALAPSAPGVWDLLSSAALTVRSDDLAKVDALLKALSPPPSDSAPVYITSGSLNADLRFSRQGTITTANIASLKTSNLQLRSGAANYQMPKDVDIKGQITLDAQSAPDTDPVAQIRQLAVTELAGSLGVADLAVTQPLIVTDLAAASPSVKGAVRLSGRLQTVTGLLEVLQGAQPGTLYPYVGDFVVDQSLSTAGGQSAAAGKVSVTGLQLLDSRGTAVFSEDRLDIVNDVTYSPTGTGELRIRDLAIAAASSNAITLKASGTLRDLAGTRTFAEPLKVDLGYDLDKLFPLIVPLLDPETQQSLAGAVVSGKYQKQFTVSGSYPATVAPEVAIRNLSVTGGLGIAAARIPAYGLDLTKFEPDFQLKDGTAALTMASPAGLNGGTLNLSGTTVQLSEPEPRLSMPDNLVVVEGVALNKFAAEKLGRYMGPLFVNTDRASGVLQITFARCSRVPLGALIEQKTPANDGVAEVVLNVKDLELIGGFAGRLIRDLGGLGSVFVGNVNNARFVVKDGVVNQNFPITLGKGVTADVRFSGNIELAAPQRLNPLQVRVGSALFRDRIPLVRDVVQLADPVFVIEGTVSQPKIDIAKGIEQWVKDQAGGILPGIFRR